MKVVLAVGLLVAAVAFWPSTGGRVPCRREGSTRDGPRTDDEGRKLVLSRRRWRGKARRLALETGLAELVAAIAAPLRTGVAPSVALAAAEARRPDDPALAALLHDLVLATRSGTSLAGVWLRHAALHDSADLRFVGQAWALSERTGAPLADALATGEEVLRARARGRDRVASAAAGPRASMAVLCLLPASGPLVGMAVGVGPRSLYFSSPVATASLAVGVLLAVGAWWWSRWILRRAT